jgi:hypothetical protein
MRLKSYFIISNLHDAPFANKATNLPTRNRLTCKGGCQAGLAPMIWILSSPTVGEKCGDVPVRR